MLHEDNGNAGALCRFGCDASHYSLPNEEPVCSIVVDFRHLDGLMTPARLVRFGLYEVDFGARELRKDGAKIKLQDRPFEILSIFLERPGEVITREEFRERLWPADTFVDFDHSLNASINKLRQALNDDADNPRFIATTGRKGYRFISPVGNATPTPVVERTEAPSQPTQVSAPADRSEVAPRPETVVKAPVAASSASPLERHKWRYAALLSGTVFLVVLGVLVWPRLHPKPALTEEDSILISDFVNTTGEPIFDDTLKQALTVKLSESPFFNIVPDMKVKQQLGLMGHSANDRVVFPVDREVCERLGAKALVAGSIVSVGNKYELDLNVLDCLKGEVLAHQKTAVENRDQVLPAMGSMIPPLRRTVGESLASVQKFDTPIEQATTTSLGALKAYTEGDKKRQQGKEIDSIPFYKLAIELDPNFAIAYVRLGVVYSNSQDYKAAEDYLQKAFEKSDRVSEREKLYITAHYYSDLTHEEEKAVQTYELWRQIYPRDWIAANNLGNECTRLGRFDKAVEAGQAALRLNPAHIFPYIMLARAYKNMGRYAEARAVCEKAAAAKMDSVDIHDLLFEMAFGDGDQAAMQRELALSKGKSGEERIVYNAAWAATSVGHIRQGRSLFQDARAKAIADDLKQYAAVIALDEGRFEAELGNPAEARTAVALAYRFGSISDVWEAQAALVLARIGDSDRAEQIEQHLGKQFPLHLILNRVALPEIRATLAIGRNDPARAIQELQSAIPYDLGDTSGLWTIYYRGTAYLQLRSGKEAENQFQRILDQQAVQATSLVVPLARLGLARAYALSGGTAKSRNAYEDFLNRWKDADPDIPILLKAKTEYARVKVQ